jgi:hypothetical protein
MGAIWEWLRDPENRSVLGWLGGGAVVVIGGLWGAWRATRKPGGGEGGKPSVSATHGGVAIGGSADKATIKTGRK